MLGCYIPPGNKSVYFTRNLLLWYLNDQYKIFFIINWAQWNINHLNSCACGTGVNTKLTNS